MPKNKTHIIVSIIICIYIIFAIVIIIIFNLIRNDPIDKIAMPYLWDSNELIQEYGEIKHIGRNSKYATEKTKNTLNVPYGIETTNNQIIVYVKLENKEDTWIPVNTEVKEVIENVD